MYVLGGLVDESIAKNVTARFAANNALNTARLPIAEYMEREPGSTAHTVLTINQVIDILLCVHCTGDWRGALGANVPLRKGYRVKSVVD
jgi:Trm5-related predicted tRNA methylase